MRDVLPDIDQIRRDSDELRRLNARIHETSRNRYMDPEAWQAAIDAFGQAFGSRAFPGGYERYERFLQGDDSELEAVLRFIEADPRHFRSGYMKEALWRRLARIDLDDEARARLEKASLRRLGQPFSRDYWYLCRAMVRIGRESFREEVLRASEQEADKQGPAHCLFAYLTSFKAGETMYRRARDRWLAPTIEKLRRRNGR